MYFYTDWEIFITMAGSHLEHIYVRIAEQLNNKSLNFIVKIIYLINNILQN